MPHRTEAVPLRTLPGSLPRAKIPDDVDHAAIATASLKHLESLTTDILTPEAIWRDILALTGTLRTFFGSAQVEAAWNETSKRHKPSGFVLIPKTFRIARSGSEFCWIQAMYSFETQSDPALTCSGIIGIIPDSDNAWKIWLLTTMVEQVKGFPNVDIMEPKINVENGINGYAEVRSHATNGITDGTNRHPRLESYFDCVVVGAGMAGLSAAGRLQALGVSAVALERHAQIGDNWTKRYDTVKLHTAKEYGHLPFSRTFPPEDPYFLSGRDLARGFQKYVDQYGINVWLSTSLESASWNDDTQTWTLTVNRESEQLILTTRHMVFALGGGGQVPSMPSYTNRYKFQGTVMHSKDYKNPHEWKGKKGIVIGTANTAHDVAEDMLDAGLASITMVQRNRTAVIPVEYYRAFADLLYNTNIPTEDADRQQFCLPHTIYRHLGMNGIRMHANKEPERFDALERVGFKCERFGDLQHFLLERLGGHYLDVGCSAKIAEGLIKVKSDSLPISYAPTGLLFVDGSTVDADVIVFCTGFEGNMRHEVSAIVGEEIGEKLEDWWGLDGEGELRGAWKWTGHPGIWYTGGTIGHARFMGRFVALQIKANIEGVLFQAYLDTLA